MGPSPNTSSSPRLHRLGLVAAAVALMGLVAAVIDLAVITTGSDAPAKVVAKSAPVADPLIAPSASATLTAKQVRIALDAISDPRVSRISDQAVPGGRVFSLLPAVLTDGAQYVHVALYTEPQDFLRTMETGPPKGYDAGRVCNAVIESGRWGQARREASPVGEQVYAALAGHCIAS